MAFTTLYLTTLAAPYTPATLRGAWDDTAGAVTRALSALKDAGGQITTVARAETNGAANFDVLLYRGVSGPLAAQTLSGTLNVLLGVLESGAAADFAFHLHVYVTQGDSDTPRGTLLTDYVETTGQEWPTTAQGKALASAQALSSLGITAGDRLVVEIGYVALNASASSVTGTLYYGTQRAVDKAVVDDLVATGTDVLLKAGSLTFSVAITEQEVAARVTEDVALALMRGVPAPVRVSSLVALALTPSPATVRVSSLVALALTGVPPPGGGTVPTGTNPPAASIPTATPQFFGVLEEMDGTILEAFAEAEGGPFADAATYFGGFKERRILSFGSISRKATTAAGGIQLSSQQLVLDDTDRYLRSLWGVKTIRGRKWSNYVVDHGDRLAELQPFRLSAGMVSDHAPLDEFTYGLTVQGMLGRHIARVKNEAKVPPNVLTSAQLPALDARFKDGWSPPIGYGLLSDESAATPQGVVPGIFVGTANLQAVFGGGALNVVVDYHVFFGHATQDTLNLYITPPGWTASTAYLVGDRVRPNLTSNGFLYECVAGGTSGASAPTFATVIGATFGDGSVTWKNIGADDPTLRYVVPTSAYGQILIDPHKPGWAAATGTATTYVDYNGYRLHVVAFLHSHRFAKALREGRMTFSGNFRAIEDAGDGSGALITAPARIFQHFWVNFVENTYATGAWFAMPTFGSYSLFDTTTVAAVTAFTDTLVSGGPVQASILFGQGGKQITVFEAVKQMAASWDLKIFENRHGQICEAIDNPAAPAAVTFTDQDDAVRFTTSPRRTGYANVVRYRYGPRYVPPVSTQLEGEQGQPMPAKAVHEHADWVSGLQTLPDAAAIAVNNGKEEYLDLDLYGVRDAATADMFAARALARAVGPAAVLEGPIGALLGTGLQGLSQAGTAVDIGTVIGITHIEGLGASGFVGAKFIVDEADVQPDGPSVTLTGELQV